MKNTVLFLSVALIFSLMSTSHAKRHQSCTNKNICLDCYCIYNPDSQVCLSCPGKGLKMVESDHVFAVTGSSCVDPIWNEGPDYAAARSAADRLAMQRCYPYQSQRESDYSMATDASDCPDRFFGAKASASYSCAVQENL